MIKSEQANTWFEVGVGAMLKTSQREVGGYHHLQTISREAHAEKLVFGERPEGRGVPGRENTLCGGPRQELAPTDRGSRWVLELRPNGLWGAWV